MSPSVLQGVTPQHDAELAHMHVKTVEDMGRLKYYKIARSIRALADFEESGSRAEQSKMNLNDALKQEYEIKSFGEILVAPVSALQGIGEKSVADLASLKIKTVKDLAESKYFKWAEAMTDIAAFETDDFSFSISSIFSSFIYSLTVSKFSIFLFNY